jgi:molybdopterin-guanine dinucleotide biosynthesis protein A
MGTDKGLLVVNGKRMVQHIIDTISLLTSSITIVTNNEEYKLFGFPVIPDLIKDKGPVGGIYSALSHSSVDSNLILSCDTPFVSLELIKKLVGECANSDVCIPSFKGRVHPLIGMYKKKNTLIYKHAIDSNSLKLMSVNQTLKTLIIETENEFKENEFTNLNTENELNKCI